MGGEKRQKVGFSVSVPQSGKGLCHTVQRYWFPSELRTGKTRGFLLHLRASPHCVQVQITFFSIIDLSFQKYITISLSGNTPEEMCLHCTSTWRGTQSRIWFSIGNVYWRQMNSWHQSHQTYTHTHLHTHTGPDHQRRLTLRPTHPSLTCSGCLSQVLSAAFKLGQFSSKMEGKCISFFCFSYSFSTKCVRSLTCNIELVIYN